jgi:maltooligosyltrehalose trehalohydrolase
MRVCLTGEHQYFLSMFAGTGGELARILQQGWLYSGEHSEFHGAPRGTSSEGLSPQSFVFCISNHDQVGNRIQGARLHATVTPAAYRAISLFLCLSPYTPLIFQGQEWACSSPFHYFTQMSDELGKKITEGRRREFVQTGFATHESELDGLLSPQDDKAFTESKLKWAEIHQGGHARMLELYRAGLKLRHKLFGKTNPPRSAWKASATDEGVRIDYHLEKRSVSVLLQLKSTVTEFPAGSNILLRSDDKIFSTIGEKDTPETIVLEHPRKKS